MAVTNIEFHGSGTIYTAIDALDAADEVCRKWLDANHVQLHAGEMTAQEKRSVFAVVAAISAEIRGLKDKFG